MTHGEWVATTRDYLRRHGVPRPRLDAELLLAHVLGAERSALYLGSDRPLRPADHLRLRELATRRARQRIPLAYLVGHREFWSRSFRVTPDVLIPRPETETLVEAALSLAPLGSVAPPSRIAEIGVGSGVITAALALELPRARFVAVERSGAALRVARQNLESLGVAQRVWLVRGDGLGALGGPFDLILSNPPYIPTARLPSLPAEVRREPSLALDGGPDGLDFIRHLARAAPQRLTRPGWLALEVGQGQAGPVRCLLERVGASEVATRRDLAGVERVVLARFGED